MDVDLLPDDAARAAVGADQVGTHQVGPRGQAAELERIGAGGLVAFQLHLAAPVEIVGLGDDLHGAVLGIGENRRANHQIGGARTLWLEKTLRVMRSPAPHGRGGSQAARFRRGAAPVFAAFIVLPRRFRPAGPTNPG